MRVSNAQRQGIRRNERIREYGTSLDHKTVLFSCRHILYSGADTACPIWWPHFPAVALTRREKWAYRFLSTHTGVPMNAYIAAFLFAGTCFGLATFSYRHWFSEGPHSPEDAIQPASFGSRAFWAMICTFLWPIMIVTGVNTAWVLAKRKRKLLQKP